MLHSQTSVHLEQHEHRLQLHWEQCSLQLECCLRLSSLETSIPGVVRCSRIDTLRHLEDLHMLIISSSILLTSSDLGETNKKHSPTVSLREHLPTSCQYCNGLSLGPQWKIYFISGTSTPKPKAMVATTQRITLSTFVKVVVIRFWSSVSKLLWYISTRRNLGFLASVSQALSPKMHKYQRHLIMT